MPPAIFAPAIAALAVLAFLDMTAWEAAMLGVVGGYGIWTLSEYWIHRAVFHFEPQEGLGARVHWIDPRRAPRPPERPDAPRHAAGRLLPLAAAFCGVFIGVFGTPLAWAVSAGFFAGYLAYDMLHFALHHARPKTAASASCLRELHMRHHFEDDERGFAVSAPWWDIVFGTYSRKAR